MDTRSLMEMGLVLIMVVFSGGIAFDRMIMGRKGVGAKLIQFMVVIFVIPAIMIAYLDNKLTGEPLATVIGTIVGYGFGQLGKGGKDEP